MGNTLVRHRNTKLIVSKRRANYIMSKGLMLVFGFTLLFGCKVGQDNTVTEELIGEWVTNEPRYQDCSFEIQRETIIYITI